MPEPNQDRRRKQLKEQMMASAIASEGENGKRKDRDREPDAPVEKPADEIDDSENDKIDPVHQAGLESFPASDPPSWTP